MSIIPIFSYILTTNAIVRENVGQL